MKSKILTVIPVYNGEPFILETLQSIARQTLRSDRLIVLDNCSTDRTPQIVQGFTEQPVEYFRNPQNLGLFGNCNRALEFAPETEYLHLSCADDLVTPEFYATLTRELADCPGFGLAYSLDERIDEHSRPISISGKPSGAVKVFGKDEFLARKAEIANQSFSGSLLKTGGRASPVQFRLDMPILADVAFWAAWGQHCDKVVEIKLPLSKYRWHGTNTTHSAMPSLQALVTDEWRVMQLNEALRGQPPGFVRRFKLKGLFGVRTGIKAKRVRQLGHREYARQIIAAGKTTSGWLAWWMAQVVVEARDLAIYGLLRRPRHPKNVYS